uniref:Snurportin-1 n=1 Tax=Arion vulgaris TaxID=1028688 RepID=A0A0B7B4X4_9EUPU
MSYYRGYDDGDYGGYGDEAYSSRYESVDRYGDREDRDRRSDRSFGRRESSYDRRDIGGYEGRRESDYERRLDVGYDRRDDFGGRRERSFGSRREDDRGDGSFKSRRGGGGSFSRENGGRGGKRSFGGKSQGDFSKRFKADDNWEQSDRHSTMLSHFLETVPENFEEDWLCIVCPAGKRRVLVAASISTQTYRKDGKPDMTFKSCLPNGSPQQTEVMKYNDLTILDAVFCTQSKQFYIIDMLHWKHYPYYETEAEFRAFFLPEKYSQLKTPTELSENNEYPLILLEKFPCSDSSIEQALNETAYKVEGLLFINKKSIYECTDSPNSLLLRLDQLEKVLGIPVPEGLSYIRTSSEDTKWKEELIARKKLKAVREAARNMDKTERHEGHKKVGEERDEHKVEEESATESWAHPEVGRAYSAAYYD